MAQRKQEKRNYGEEELTHTVHVDADIFSELHKSLAESGEEGQSNGAAAIQNSQSVAFTNSMESNKGVAGSSPYDPEKPGIKSLAAAKEKRDRKAKERTLQLETDLAEALNNRDRCLNDLRKAQNVKSAANAILKAYKKEIDKQQTKDSMAWSRALERAETFVGRIQKILSVDGLKILNKHQSSMRKFYDAMHELRTNIARLERICPSDSSGEQLSSLDKQALTKEIEILRAENEMLRERNTATDLNSDDYYHVNVDTNTRSQLQLKSAQLASARQQLRQMQETNKALVSAIRNVFPSMQGLSDEDIMSTASKEPHGNQPTSLEPPKNSAIQSHSGGQLQLPHGSFTQLQRLAHSTTLKKQTSLKQLFDDFHTVPGKAQKSSNSNTGSSSKSVSQYSSARTTNSSRTTQNVSAKKVQSLQEQVNILADELVRLCFLLGKAEAKASKDPSGKEQRQGKKPKKKKGNTEASQWKTEMEERVTSIEACLGESSSTALNALNIAQDSIRMVTRHCAEAEDRLSHSQARICAENENLRQKISRLGRLLERTRASNASLKSAASSSELAPINSKSKSTKSSAQSSARNTSTSSPLIPENSPSLQPRSSSSKRLPKKNSPQIPKKPSESSMKPSPLANSTRTTVSSAPSSESIVHRPNESSVTPTKAETRGQMFDTVNSHLAVSSHASPSTNQQKSHQTNGNEGESAAVTSSDHPQMDTASMNKVEEIRREGEELLPELKAWENEFEEEYGRKPSQTEKFNGVLGHKYRRFRDLAAEMHEASKKMGLVQPSEPSQD